MSPRRRSQPSSLDEAHLDHGLVEILPASRSAARRVARGVVGLLCAFGGGLAAIVVAIAVLAASALDGVPTFAELDASWGGAVPAIPASHDPSDLALPTAEPPQPTSADASGASPDQASVTTYVIFSTGVDSISHAEAEAIGVSDPERRGTDTLTDVLMVLMVDRSSGRSAVVSIPRDTWLEHRGSRINRVFEDHGPGALAHDVANLTGLVVDHLVRVDMRGFVSLVDALGGIDLDMPHAVRDGRTGLSLPAGRMHLDGVTALQFVRSRHVEQRVDDVWQSDPTADFGRMERQRRVLVALVDAAWSIDLVARVPSIVDLVQDHVVVDEELGIREMVEVANRLRKGSGALPGFQVQARVGRVGDASVVFADPAEARSLVRQIVEMIRRE